MAALSSGEKMSLKCPECEKEEFVSDSCAAEDMLVCNNCGYVMEAGRLCDQTPSVMERGGRGGIGRGASNIRSVQYASHKDYQKIRKARLTIQINKICGHLKIREHDRTMILGSLTSSVLSELQRASDAGVAAALVFILASDQTLVSLRKINEVFKLKEKPLRKLIRKVKSLPTFSDAAVKPKVATIQEVVINFIDKCCIVMDIQTKKECVAISSSIFELLLNTELQNSLQKCLLSRGAPILTPIVLLAAEHVSKTKLQDKKLFHDFSEKLCAQKRSVVSNGSLVRRHLLSLAKKIPSLAGHDLKATTVTKYLSTILQNKGYLTAEKKVTDHDKREEEVLVQDSLSLQSQSSSCQQPQFLCTSSSNWLNDDSESDLSDLDDSEIEQYLATSDEIEDKKRLMASD